MTLKLSQVATRGRIVISLVAMAAALAAAVVLQSAGGPAIVPGSSPPVQRITLSGLDLGGARSVDGVGEHGSSATGRHHPCCELPC